MMDLKRGQKIIVFDAQKCELGEGTLIRATPHSDLGVIAYECVEHTILAKGIHYVRLPGTDETLYPVSL